MPLTVTEHDDGRIVDFGDKARIERRLLPEQEPVIDSKTGAPFVNPFSGQPVTRDVIGSDGKPVHVWVAYEKVAIEPNQDGKRLHPVHGEETTYTYVWVIRGQGSEAEARAFAEKIAA